MWIHAPEESRESVMLRLSARNGGTVSIVKLGRSPNESAAKSIQVFFSYVSRYLKYQDHFKDAVFLMQGVDIGVFDEYDRPVGNGAWDIYAQLGEDRFNIHYWAVHNGTRNGNHDAIAYTSIPKYSTFVHFSPCGQKFSLWTLATRQRFIIVGTRCLHAFIEQILGARENGTVTISLSPRA